MISRNVTTLTKDLVLANLVKTARKNTISKFILAVVILVLGFVIMLNGILTNNTLYTVLGAFFELCGVAYVIMATIAVVNAPKDMIKNNPEIEAGDIVYNFTFKEESIEIIVNSNGKKKTLKYTYDQVKKVNEFKDRYDLILKEHQILFIYKDGFKEEKSEEIFKINLDKKKKKIVNKIKEEVAGN